MKTPWKKSTFVSATSVVHNRRSHPRHGKRLTGILRAKKVKLNPTPVILGESPESIKVTPVIQDGQVRALHVACSCGCESTFDVQYAANSQGNAA